MKSLARVVLAIAWLWCCAPSVQGQKATEVFIPIGQSAGLSGKLTLIGKIAAVNTQNRTITATDESGTHTVHLSERTKIYVDLSLQRSPNRAGTLADLRTGLLAEVKFEGNDRTRGVAEWIKVQIME
jgi:hypothetical protein